MKDSFDQEKAGSALERAVIEVFNEMSFIDVAVRSEPVQGEAEGNAATQTRVHAVIDVLKPMSCRLELRMNQSLRSRISGILFDGAPADEDKERDDSILEILNVIAGSFLTDYFGKGAEIKLELPRYLYFREADEGESVVTLDLDAEGEQLQALLSSVRYRY